MFADAGKTIDTAAVAGETATAAADRRDHRDRDRRRRLLGTARLQRGRRALGHRMALDPP
jgi:hypothetical protein